MAKSHGRAAVPTLSELTQRLEGHLRSLSGPRDPYLNSGKHKLAQQYIRTELGKWGEVTSQRLMSQNREYFNWMTSFPGSRPQLAPILVGAHYDTVPGSPGADDNASGVAVLLVLAELFSQQPTHRPVHFIAFDLEEYGLIGSSTCAKAWKTQRKPIHLMLSLEMLGYFSDAPQQYPLDALSRIYPDTGNFIALIGNGPTLTKMIAMQRGLRAAKAPCQWLPVINKGRQIPETRRSDHAPFWDEGYPAVMVTDTAHLRNPHYHTASDRIETLNIEMMAKITQGLFTSLRQM
ncbi:MAG: M28 family peptidase [Phormidesmis sp.]